VGDLLGGARETTAAGRRTATQQRLWQRYFQRLVRLAQARLRAAPPTLPADGEKVRQS
jgi:hypothetical protein